LAWVAERLTIVVGNAKAIVAKVGFLSDSPVDLGDSVRDVHSNVAFIIKSLFFCFIGLMIGPPWGMVFAACPASHVPARWFAVPRESRLIPAGGGTRRATALVRGRGSPLSGIPFSGTRIALPAVWLGVRSRHFS